MQQRKSSPQGPDLLGSKGPGHISTCIFASQCDEKTEAPTWTQGTGLLPGLASDCQQDCRLQYSRLQPTSLSVKWEGSLVFRPELQRLRGLYKLWSSVLSKAMTQDR